MAAGLAAGPGLYIVLFQFGQNVYLNMSGRGMMGIKTKNFETGNGGNRKGREEMSLFRFRSSAQSSLSAAHLTLYSI
jgi:hypothetical protein